MAIKAPQDSSSSTAASSMSPRRAPCRFTTPRSRRPSTTSPICLKSRGPIRFEFAPPQGHVHHRGLAAQRCIDAGRRRGLGPSFQGLELISRARLPSSLPPSTSPYWKRQNRACLPDSWSLPMCRALGPRERASSTTSSRSVPYLTSGKPSRLANYTLLARLRRQERGEIAKGTQTSARGPASLSA